MRVPDDAPDWPPWTAAAALAGALAIVVVAALLVAAVSDWAGSERLTAGERLALSLVRAVGLLGLIWFLASRTRPIGGAQLGLRPPRLETGIAASVAGLAALVAVAVGLSLAGDPSSDVAAPEELDPRSSIQGSELDVAASFDLDAAVALLARAVVDVVALSVLFFGLVLPVLCRWAGLAAGTLLTAIGTVVAGEALAAVPIALGLSVLYLWTGSILPGLALAALGSGLAIGTSLDWSLAGAALAGCLCAAAALALSLTAAAAFRGEPRYRGARALRRHAGTGTIR